MRERGVAGRYARALLEAARADSSLDGVGESMAGICQVMIDNPSLPSFLEGPQVAQDEKKKLINDVLGDKVEPLVIRFIYLLIDKNRIEYLVDIGKDFATLVEHEQGFKRAMVTTAVPLPADLETALSEKLAALTGSKIIMEKSVDPAVVGGVSVTLGDQIIDGTVRSNLDKLKQLLGKTSVR